uniref:Membrane-associated kinase regulator 6 n=1 Tax=Rhizophora mucronata TaxID=61149 RepID=A0A2P2IS61_RHIMU
MESLQSLATESFSHSWLAGLNPSSCGFDEEAPKASLGSSYEATSKESVHKMLSSKGFQEENQNFNFDVPTSRSSDTTADADQLFSDGLIRPAFVHQPRIGRSSSLDAVRPTPPSSFPSTHVPAVDIQCNVLQRWRKLSKRVLRKCFGQLRPTRIGGSIKSIKVDDIDRKASEVKSLSNSPETSPGQSPPYSTDVWSDAEYESPIYEAVLHCKKSIDK